MVEPSDVLQAWQPPLSLRESLRGARNSQRKKQRESGRGGVCGDVVIIRTITRCGRKDTSISLLVAELNLPLEHMFYITHISYIQLTGTGPGVDGRPWGSSSH